MNNKTALLILMVVLIAFVVLLSVLGIVYIIALRKRRPVVKVVMAPRTSEYTDDETGARAVLAEAQSQAQIPEAVPAPVVAEPAVPEPVVTEPEVEEPVEEEADDTAEEAIPVEEGDEDDESTGFITIGNQILRFDRSFTAKVSKLALEPKEWYSEIKNELLSYTKVKSRMSWKRETFRVGRKTVARLIIRGKTLCLLLAADPAKYTDTKYSVEDVSHVSSTADTPMLYRIKSARRLTYAIELIREMMGELEVLVNPLYKEQNFRLPFATDVTLIKRGHIKLIGEEAIVATFMTLISEEPIPEEEDLPTAEEMATPAEEVAPRVEEVKPEVKEDAVAEADKEAVPPAGIDELDDDDDDDDGEVPVFVTEGSETVRYDRSFTAKACQLNNKVKEWYSVLKNELLSYDKVKVRMSWKRETFRIGRMAVARLAIRGKTLCLLLAVEPEGYSGTRYSVEDVSGKASTVDTPTMYRIKSPRRLKYAKEIIAGMMEALKTVKRSAFEPQDYYLPYEGDMSLMQRGLVKRVVTGTTRIFKIEEVDSYSDDANDGKDTTDGEEV